MFFDAGGSSELSNRTRSSISAAVQTENMSIVGNILGSENWGFSVVKLDECEECAVVGGAVDIYLTISRPRQQHPSLHHEKDRKR